MCSLQLHPYYGFLFPGTFNLQPPPHQHQQKALEDFHGGEEGDALLRKAKAKADASNPPPRAALGPSLPTFPLPSTAGVGTSAEASFLRLRRRRGRGPAREVPWRSRRPRAISASRPARADGGRRRLGRLQPSGEKEVGRWLRCWGSGRQTREQERACRQAGRPANLRKPDAADGAAAAARLATQGVRSACPLPAVALGRLLPAATPPPAWEGCCAAAAWPPAPGLALGRAELARSLTRKKTHKRSNRGALLLLLRLLQEGSSPPPPPFRFHERSGDRLVILVSCQAEPQLSRCAPAVVPFYNRLYVL